MGANFVFSVFLDPESGHIHLFPSRKKIFFGKIFDPQKTDFQKFSIFFKKFSDFIRKKKFFFIFSETLEFSYGAEKNHIGKILALKNISKHVFLHQS